MRKRELGGVKLSGKEYTGKSEWHGRPLNARLYQASSNNVVQRASQ